jgi:hypothetical protein
MTRDILIEIGKKIKNSGGTEQELEILSDLFDKNVPHPEGSSLFLYPENHSFRDEPDISEYDPSVEEVVDKCLNYKPIYL